MVQTGCQPVWSLSASGDEQVLVKQVMDRGMDILIHVPG